MGDQRSFDGNRLRLARELHGTTLTALAATVGVTPGYISQLEKNRKAPTELVRDALAEVLHVLPAFFEPRPSPPVVESECNFRSRRTTPSHIRAAARARATLLSEYVSAVEDKVDGMPSYEVPGVAEVDSIEAASLAGERVRQELGLGLDAPIDDMITVLEHCGVVVSRLNGTSDKVDAFSWVSGRGIVALSADNGTPTRTRFNAAHELGHLVMHKGRVEDPHVDEERERQADAFASSFLLPRRAFMREFPRSFSWTAVFEMKQRWKVSASSITYTAHKYGLLSALEYQRAYKYMSARGWRKGEPREPVPEEPSLLAQVADFVDVSEVMQWLGWTPEIYMAATGLRARERQASRDVGVGAGRVIDLAAVRAERGNGTHKGDLR